MSKPHPAILKQLRNGRRFAIFGMVVTSVYVIGTLIEYLGGWDETLDARALTGGTLFFLISGALYLGFKYVLRRVEDRP